MHVKLLFDPDVPVEQLEFNNGIVIQDPPDVKP